MKRAMRYITLFVCASLTLILMTPSALGLTRRTQLSNFINSAITPSGGYQSTALPSNASQGYPELASTSYAINMEISLGKTASEFITPTSWILDNLKTGDSGFKLDTTETTATTACMYLATSALNITVQTSSLGADFRTWITNRRNVTSGGFDNQVSGITTTLATYYAIESLYYLGNTSLVLLYGSDAQNYFQNCLKSDGGYAEIIGKDSTLESTWAAIAGLSRLSTIIGFSLAGTVNIANVLQYISQFYFSSESDKFNYGGYGTSDRATVRDTYFVQKIYTLLGQVNPNAEQVQTYLLDCQNIADGGFAEKNTMITYRTSSMITSFYAFESLRTMDSQLGMLNVEVWFLPFDYILLIIILGVVIVVLAGGIHYYRKHHE